MAPRKSRAEKTVLSRQDIAQKRRALQKKRRTGAPTKAARGGGGRRALFITFLLAVSVLMLLSVATFDPQDRVGPGFENAVGPVGHLIAETLRGLLGICAYVLPLAGLYTVYILIAGDRDRRRGAQFLSLCLLVVSGSVLAQLTFQGAPGWAHDPGGMLGRDLGGLLSGLFSTVGTVVLVSALAIAALIVGTEYAFLRLCGVAWSWVQLMRVRVEASLNTFIDRQQAAWERRRERREQERLEEAAFLSQLEADEEELDDAERELLEAEAAAEEAAREARLIEERERLAAQRASEREEEEAPASRRRLLSRKESRKPRVALPPGREIVDAAEVVDEPHEDRNGEPAWVSSLEALGGRGSEEQPEEVSSTRSRRAPAVVAPVTPEPTEAPVAPSRAAASEPAPAAANARTPLIVAPKGPPAPTAKPEFQFVGDRTSFSLPPLEVLETGAKAQNALDKDAFLSTAEKLRAKLADFGISGEVVEIRPGPVVTMYEFLPGPGIKVSKIAALSDDLAMAMEALRVRIVAPIPGKGVVGIEVPNKDRETVYLKEIAEQDAFTKSSSKLTMCMGKDIEGMPYVLDLAKAPHLLIAGTTGSGKSVAVNAMIMSMLLKSTPEEVRFIMVDPKMLELSVYEGIPHLLLPVVTDPKKAALALRWAVEEMERRYALLSAAGVRNIAGYNKLIDNAPKVAKTIKPKPAAKKPAASKKDEDSGEVLVVDLGGQKAAPSPLDGIGVPAPRDDDDDVRAPLEGDETVQVPVLGAENDDASEDADETAAPEPMVAAEESGEAAVEEEAPKKLPYIVVIIDELADLMMVASRDVETYVARLAQMARAAGIHLMVATQRPSTDVVTGIIKANFPTRISFMLRSKPDSMTILGTVGAEALLGMGDMLIMPPTSAHLQRVHGAYVSEVEIQRAVEHLKAQGKPVYDDSILKPRDEDAEGGQVEDELSDELYDQALATVSEMKQVSISMLQRKMRIGYNRAARMIERMERDGVVGPADGAKPREVLLRPVGEMPGAAAM
ncbi:MAG TPA: DNA translocase FtsK 4TM domain-containing protein [Myxococcaceae bacterium]|nr:DNA translocase FtsK 4TM domain-containing protein [Myxococcaceae bacterium]